jgi:ArsR family metal-binding transcriptional regulator
MNKLGLIKLLEKYEKSTNKRKFIVKNIDEILEILYSLKFKIDRLYEATQVTYDKRSKIVRVYMPVRKNAMLGYFSKHIGIEDDKIEIIIKLLKDIVELLKDCKNLKEKDLDCNAFLKAFHRYV